MICEVCEKEIGSRGYAILAKPEPIHGCKECMEIVEGLILCPASETTESPSAAAAVKEGYI